MAQQAPSQTQRIITALAASILVFYLWVFVYQRFFYEPPAPPATAPAPGDVAPPPTATAPTTTWPEATAPAPAAEWPTQPPAADGLVATGGEDSTEITLGDASSDSQYPMALELTPRGAAVKNAWVRGYYQTVDKEDPYRIFQPLPASDRSPERYSLETSKVRFVELDQEVLLDRVTWKVENATPEQVVFSTDVHGPDTTPVARVLKTYTLPAQPPGNGPDTYDVLLALRIENLTQAPLTAVLVQQGPIGFQQEARMEDRKIIGAIFDREGRAPAVKGHLRSALADKDLLELGRDEGSSRIGWVAEANQYFTCIMSPMDRLGFEEAVRFERADAIHLVEGEDGEGEDLTFRYVTTPLPLAPGRGQDVVFDCYIGPKSKQIFQEVPKYAQRDYYAVIRESFYMCAPGALVALMMRLLNMFHRIPPHNYGIAIILLVIIVRTILHPITKRSQVNMMKMQKQMSSLQPKINAVKEKHANDRAAMNQAMMEVYRDAGVNPAGSMLTCLPMALQLPIWAALWTALNSTVEMRHAPFDGWWIRDLTQPDALIAFGTSFQIPLMGTIHSFNLLPILLAISQLLQAKYMPRSTAPTTGGNPDQMDQQRKMMMFMSVFFLFLFYNMPSGLNLYIMTSNLVGILEQWRIRKHIAEEEKKGKFAPPGPKRKSWFQQKWEELQKEAEDVKKVQSSRPKKRK